jgi:hypothetical protein
VISRSTLGLGSLIRLNPSELLVIDSRQCRRRTDHGDWPILGSLL